MKQRRWFKVLPYCPCAAAPAPQFGDAREECCTDTDVEFGSASFKRGQVRRGHPRQHRLADSVRQHSCSKMYAMGIHSLLTAGNATRYMVGIVKQNLVRIIQPEDDVLRLSTLSRGTKSTQRTGTPQLA